MAAKLGIKGLQHILGQLPSWLSYTATEKMEVRAGGALIVVLLSWVLLWTEDWGLGGAAHMKSTGAVCSRH